MKRNHEYLAQLAHSSYVTGLKKTGISIDHIPSIKEMNESLGKIGWAAVTVDGFIPPSAFMEFQKHNVLVIAADIRPFDQIEYTPAPDIIHEAAGHAPIIADDEYAEYLRYFGEIGSKAISSKSDYKIYEAIRHLSILKANPYSLKKDILEAEKNLKLQNDNAGMPSEMTLIRNLHWWTVEYGLIGEMKNPKIYGAGLLSSIGESKNALSPEITKLPYSIDAIDYGFDITKLQPQLFVSPNFKYLTEVLDEFANQMAFRTGGLDGIAKAIESEEIATIEYSSGLQVSGVLSNVIINNGRPVYFNTSGGSSLNFKNKMIEGEGREVHAEGYGSPIGKIKGSLKPTRYLSDNELSNIGIKKGKNCTFEFNSGVKVSGKLLKILRKEGVLILLSFTNCTVTHKGQTLFAPTWGQYDMAVGENIVSVFSGPADPDGYCLISEPAKEKTHKIEYDEQTKQIHEIYENLELLKKKKNITSANIKELLNKYKNTQQDDWLLLLEIYETHKQSGLCKEIAEEIWEMLIILQQKTPSLSNLIQHT
jgi:phenylalanine-4-hydroxylase